MNDLYHVVASKSRLCKERFDFSRQYLVRNFTPVGPSGSTCVRVSRGEMSTRLERRGLKIHCKSLVGGYFLRT